MVNPDAIELIIDNQTMINDLFRIITIKQSKQQNLKSIKSNDIKNRTNK